MVLKLRSSGVLEVAAAARSHIRQAILEMPVSAVRSWSQDWKEVTENWLLLLHIIL